MHEKQVSTWDLRETILLSHSRAILSTRVGSLTSHPSRCELEPSASWTPETPDSVCLLAYLPAMKYQQCILTMTPFPIQWYWLIVSIHSNTRTSSAIFWSLVLSRSISFSWLWHLWVSCLHLACIAFFVLTSFSSSTIIDPSSSSSSCKNNPNS